MEDIDSLIVERLWIVAERVGKFLDCKGLRSDLAQELYAAGCLRLTELLKAGKPSDHYYIRKAVDNAILRAWQSDRLLPVPASTRRYRVKRKRKAGDYHREPFPRLTTRVDEWRDIIECYELLYSLCRDDVDRQIIEARWEGGMSIHHGPVNVLDVARQVGLTANATQSKLNDLEARYYRHVNRRLPTVKRRQRKPR